MEAIRVATSLDPVDGQAGSNPKARVADHTSGIASNGVVIVRSNQNRIDAPALVSLPVD